MPQDGFLGANRYRAFPFVTGTISDLPDAAVVDAGFAMAAKSTFQPGEQVTLQAVQRSGDWFTFTFISNCPALVPFPITFRRHLSDPEFLVEHVSAAETDDSDVLQDSLSGSTLDYADCDEPLWSGYMVSGDMAALADYLPGDIGRVLNALLEPALVQTLTDSYVVSLNLANADRTRATAPAGCDAIVWPYPTGMNFVNAICLTGAIQVAPGYNATVAQDTHNNAIVLGAAVGAGLGTPCQEIPLFVDEVPPEHFKPLAGGPPCNTVLRSINGVGGPFFNFTTGAGVSLAPQPGDAMLVMNVNMTGLALCPASLSEFSETLSESL